MAKVTVAPGVGLEVTDWGAGKPIVLLHGWPANHRIFEYHMLKLAQRGFRVIGVDLRGYGMSDKPWDGNDYDTWANDVGALIERMNLQDVLLAGYSFGGAIAAHFAGTRRDPRVTQLALVSAAAPAAAPGPAEKKLYDKLIESLQKDPGKFGNDYATSMFGSILSAEMLAMLVLLGMQTSLWGAMRGLEEMRDRDLSPELRNIQLPTHILHGVFDTTIPILFAEEQQRLIPNATLIPFQKSGHALIFEEKDRFVEELAHFAASGGVAKAA
ncbi:MAG: alpha/beta fold hydrolase [Armatimonadota bacterium]